jgi:hypothetical protein
MGWLLLGMSEGKIWAIIWARELAERQIGNARELRSWTRNDGENSGDENVNRRAWKSTNKRDGVLNCCRWVRDGTQALVAPEGGG